MIEYCRTVLMREIIDAPRDGEDEEADSTIERSLFARSRSGLETSPTGIDMVLGRRLDWNPMNRSAEDMGDE